jgi:hypothetical protein
MFKLIIRADGMDHLRRKVNALAPPAASSLSSPKKSARKKTMKKMKRSDFELWSDASRKAYDDRRKKKKKSLPNKAGSSKSSLDVQKEPEAIKKPRPRPRPAMRTIAEDPEEDEYGMIRRKVVPEPAPTPSREQGRNASDQRQAEDVEPVPPPSRQTIVPGASLEDVRPVPPSSLSKKRPSEGGVEGDRETKKARLEKKKALVRENIGNVEQAVTKPKTRLGKQQEEEKNKRNLRSRSVK